MEQLSTLYCYSPINVRHLKSTEFTPSWHTGYCQNARHNDHHGAINIALINLKTILNSSCKLLYRLSKFQLERLVGCGVIYDFLHGLGCQQNRVRNDDADGISTKSYITPQLANRSSWNFDRQYKCLQRLYCMVSRLIGARLGVPRWS